MRKGSKHTEETREKIRKNHADVSGKNNPMHGKRLYAARNGHWKGGRIKLLDYVYIYSPKHPYRNNRRYYPEHRLVVEKQIGRYLKLREVTHHLGNKDDNHPHMLMAFTSQSAHKRFERGGKVNPKDIIFDGRTLCKKS